MRLIRVDWVLDEMELARDIPSAALGAAPLLKRGVRLTRALAARLASHGVRAVWIEDDMGDGIVPAQPLPDHVRTATELAVGSCLDAARSVAADLNNLPARTFEQLERAAEGMMRALAECPAASCAFDDLATADSYTYSHSVRVATLGLLLGQRIDRIDGWIDFRGQLRHDRMVERMTQLAMGLLIHDIGKISVPESILNKPGSLTEREWELIKTHPAAGVSMISDDLVSPLTRCVVRDHHERWDGLGYPAGRGGEEIHPFARIAAVADVYDAITADRPYRSAAPPHIGVRLVREGAGTQFDERIVEHFLRVAMPYPVGYTIAMPDGSPGVVVGVDPEEPEYPVIRHRDAGGQLTEAAMHVVDGVVERRAGDGVAAAA
ncbi:MAG TPA: HD-GYP domain-containing protein [Solirubrobacteraceae bacterium]|jgi:HD-GYP domain-containing protein (c-di-GMP phosphodiesterase class II)|nr:HD-GYP domain-containing protein [Solirubrobacteraceae bacterium]